MMFSPASLSTPPMTPPHPKQLYTGTLQGEHFHILQNFTCFPPQGPPWMYSFLGEPTCLPMEWGGSAQGFS